MFVNELITKTNEIGLLFSKVFVSDEIKGKQLL